MQTLIGYNLECDSDCFIFHENVKIVSRKHAFFVIIKHKRVTVCIHNSYSLIEV